jgi:putative phosphoesterase
MRIGVLTDTHMQRARDLPGEIRRAFSEVDMIVHAGDIVTLDVYEGLKSIRETIAVRGNMDLYEVKRLLPEKEEIKVCDKRIGIIHGWGAPQGITERIRDRFDRVDAIIYGHSHTEMNRKIEGVLFFNPGRGSLHYGILEVDDDIRGQIYDIE